MQPDETAQLKQRIATLEREMTVLKQRGYPYRGVRKRSANTLWGLPLYDIAMGPDPDKGELRGHARGVIAIGDFAAGVIAIGGIARGVIAMGGLALGLLFGMGGLGVGLLAVGGLAVGGLAIGGGAIGVVAIGGGAFGYYAVGGGAFGAQVIDAMRQDPEAVRFFNEWLPFLQGAPGSRRGG
jgi:hypothetical protein